MEDFGNIVYVVAAIAWFAWNTYKKSQDGNKKPATASRKKAASRPIGQKAEEPILQETRRHENADKFLNTDLTHSHLAEDYKMSESEMMSHRVERQVRKLEVEETDEESLIDALLPNGFDLRQAVVLNAILERPYK